MHPATFQTISRPGVLPLLCIALWLFGAAACGEDDADPVDAGGGGVDAGTDAAGGAGDGGAGADDAGGGDAGEDGGGDAGGDAGHDAGSGFAPTDHGAFGSGTRLRAHFYDGGGGARVFRHFHDMELDLDCRFRDRGDGRYFCYPLAGAGHRFAGADCALPAPGSGVEEGSFVFGGRGSCEGMSGAYEVGALGDAKEVYRPASGGRCVSSGMQQARAVTRLDDALFVEASVEQVGEGSVRALRLVAEDGAFVHTDLGGADGVPCTELTVAGEARCVAEPIPSIDANGGYFYTDDECTEQEAAVLLFGGVPVCLARQPEVVSVRDPAADECASGQRLLYRAAQQRPDDSQIWLGSGSSCERASESSVFQGQRYWDYGEEVAGSEFPLLALEPQGSGPLTVDYVVDAGETPLLHRNNVDSWHLADGTPCYLEQTADDTLRCISAYGIPAGLDPVTEWSDPECSVPLDVRTADCGERYDYFFQFEDGRVTAAYTAVEHTGDVYHDVGDGCELIEATDDYGTFYAVGDEVPLTEFPEVREASD